MNRTLRIVLSILAVLIIAGGSFFGGTLYGKKQARTTFATTSQGGAFPEGAFPGGAGQRNGQGTLRGAQTGGMLLGQIQEIDDSMMVVTDPNGKQTQVKVTDTTLIEKQASVSLTDLTVGDTVMVSGSKADDGSITARSVQAGVAGRFSPPDGSAPVGTRVP